MECCSEFVFALQNRKTCFAKINRNLGVASYIWLQNYLNYVLTVFKFLPPYQGPHLPQGGRIDVILHCSNSWCHCTLTTIQMQELCIQASIYELFYRQSDNGC